ncbi:MAG: leucine-rich repeat domain-containing protein [Bacteroidales bacterium]|nr:leucine-rich repeat domain-containing protein [Bacteroidales bacterium]
MNKHYLSLAIFAMAMSLASCGNDNDDIQIQSSTPNSEIENNNTSEPLPEESGSQEENGNKPADPDSQEGVNKPVEPLKGNMTFKVSCFDEAGISKTAIMGSRKLGFKAEDKIEVHDGFESHVFTSDIASGVAATCNFVGDAKAGAQYYHAAYASIINSFLEDGLTCILVDEQTAVEDSFDPRAHIMVSTATGDKKDQFVFKTVNAFIKFTAPCDLVSVKISGNNGEIISGLDIVVSPVGGTYESFTVSGGNSNVAMLAGDIKKDGVYYISYLPTDFTNGLTIELRRADGLAASYKTNKFESRSNMVNTISAEKLAALEYKISSGGLLNYLNHFSAGSVVDIVLSDFYDPSPLTVSGIIACTDKKVRLVLPEGVETIKESYFIGCAGLEAITIPSSVTNIGSKAFVGCDNLKTVKILGTPDVLGDNYDAFGYCSSELVVYMNQATYDKYAEGYKANGINVQKLP